MPDLNDLDLKQLEDLLKNPDKIAEVTAQEPEPEQSAEPEPVPEPEPEPEPEKEAEPVSEPEPVSDVEKEMLRSRLEEMEARFKKMESMLGRRAGEADFWKRKAESIRREPAPSADEFSAPQEEEHAPQTAQEQRTPQRDGVTSFVVGQAVNMGMMEFASGHPDFETMRPDMEAYIKNSGYDPKTILFTDDPMTAKQETVRLLSEAYWHAKSAKAASEREAFAKKQAEQFARQADAKKRASISATGSRPAPKPKTPTLQDMSFEELDKELRRLTR